MTKSNVYWANRLYSQAIAAPEVEGQNEDEVVEYVRQLANEVYLDPDEMERLCEDQFIPVSTDDFKKASDLAGGSQTLTVENSGDRRI